MAGGWYFLDRDVTVNGRLSLQDGTHLIMGSQKTLDVKGLYIPQGKTLYVYGMSGDSGKIYSHPSGGAGIGAYSGRKGGNLVVYGGTIDATGYNHCAGICGGSYLDYSGGDMRGKIIFNCTPDSWIEATGGHNFNAPYKSGAAIGEGSTQEWARNHQIPFIRE